MGCVASSCTARGAAVGPIFRIAAQSGVGPTHDQESAADYQSSSVTSWDLGEPAGRYESLDAMGRILLPFLPLRVAEQLPFILDRGPGRAENGGLQTAGNDGTEHMGSLQLTTADHHALPPKAMEAAILLVDVSGFTRLSESYSRQGTLGCEQFSLLMGNFFSELTGILDSFGGEIDCFAGDAVLVVFQERVTCSTNGSAQAPQQFRAVSPLYEATMRALICAEAVTLRLSGYKTSPEDPPLLIHSALACGRVFSGICGEPWEIHVVACCCSMLGIFCFVCTGQILQRV